MKHNSNGADELITTTRITRVVRLFLCGRRMTTAEVAEIAGVTAEGARAMLGKISLELELCEPGERGGEWHLMDRDARL